ncbi:TIR domain-containing protein [Parabacteroides goldsteinii]|uniref:TIR domain-containing protein n=1 Tax=Parabacteroides goldsteinii TaxID=328812 RepID=UPI001897FE52|nr:TIR domain-containing protein [Parabacteroides goldsteinii]
MVDKEIKNVFVSHYHKDEDSIKSMKSLLGDDYSIRNYSVTSEKYNNAHNEDYIKSLLRPQISAASTFICLIGPDTHDSKWVDWEIREAERQEKQIIGVYIHGAKDSDIPPALEEFAEAIVGWRSDSIINAMNGESTFEKADGTPRNNVAGSRGTC